MSTRILLAGALAVAIALAAGCASPPPYSDSFNEALASARANGVAEVTGWYWICSVELDQAYNCPRPRGPVQTTKEAAERGLAEHLREHPEHAKANGATVKSVRVSTAE